jgi:GT2 family glycosyltransferase
MKGGSMMKEIDSNKNIAVLMTVHNRKEKTLQCLEILYNNSHKYPIKVYLTDDGCTDGTKEAILERFPNVKIINGDGSLFWNRGMLAAWEASTLSMPYYYLWLNDDTMLYNDAIDKLTNCASLFNDESIIVGQTCDLINKNVTTYGGRSKNRNHPLIENKTNNPIICDTFNGNVVLIPQNVYKKIGMLDPYFHHSFGDIEYGLRAQKAGIHNYIAPGYIGECSRNNPIPIFQRKGKSFFKRLELLYSPLGHNPNEEFYISNFILIYFLQNKYAYSIKNYNR